MYEEDAGATQVFNADDPLMGVEWSVNVSDDETRTMRAPDIAFEYLRGGLDPNDTFVWRDGMGDWIPLGQCQELLEIIRQYEGGQSPAAPAAQPDPYAGGASDPQASAPEAHEPPRAPYDPHADDDELGSTVMMDPSAQNMVEQARQAQGVSAYASPQPAPDEVSQTMASPFDHGEEDPFADARPPEAAGPPAGPRRVGERNEASALFSLDQIRAEAGQSSGGSASQDDDPFADIMSLGSGGGGIASAFAPPPINAPAPPPPPPEPTPAPVQASAPPVAGSMAPAASMPPPASMAAASMAATPQKKRTGLIIGAVAAVLLLGGGIAAFALSGSSETTAETAPTDEPTDDAGSDEGSDEEKVADGKEDDKDADDKDADDKDADGEDEKTADGGKEGESEQDKTASTKTTSSAKDDKKDDDKTAKKKDDDKTAKKKDDDKTAKKKDDDKKDDKVAKAEFNRDAARSALAAAAGAASGCKKKGGPTGRGKVVVTFAPSGRATQATVGPPFAGTAVGSCAAGAFRGASVPPFSGGAVTVSKSFFIK